MLYVYLKLRARLLQFFNLLEAVVVVQALRVQQSAARLNLFARDDLLDRELNLLAVDSRL